MIQSLFDSLEKLFKPYENIITVVGLIIAVVPIWLARKASRLKLTASFFAASDHYNLSTPTLYAKIQSKSLITGYITNNSYYFKPFPFSTLRPLNPSLLPPHSAYETSEQILPKQSLSTYVSTIQSASSIITKKNPTFARLQLKFCQFYLRTRSKEKFKVKISKEVRRQLIEHAPANALSWYEIFIWIIGHTLIWIFIVSLIAFLVCSIR